MKRYSEDAFAILFRNGDPCDTITVRKLSVLCAPNYDLDLIISNLVSLKQNMWYKDLGKDRTEDYVFLHATYEIISNYKDWKWLNTELMYNLESIDHFNKSQK